MFAVDETVGLAEWIIDDACLVSCFHQFTLTEILYPTLTCCSFAAYITQHSVFRVFKNLAKIYFPKISRKAANELQ